MRIGGSPVCVGAVPTVTTLTLSSETKATLFGIMLWRCWADSEHGIARLGTYDLQVRRYSASGLADSTPRVLTSSKFLPTQGIFAVACVNPRFGGEYGKACYGRCWGTRRERADGDVGRDWAGEAADFRAARAARWRTDKAGRPAQ